ncbi:nucleotidyltransferase family protein [Novosphingobium aquiterrae]|uniref:Nucleotidyltransferase family protein n=1 Tax=Novosphingobium aquiterrae TaxID=624388 RepID=A0ABV6PJL0_9SPHN
MQVAALRRVLFDLYGTVRFPDLAGLDTHDWQALDAMAAAAHMQPLLHVQHRGDARIPGDIAARWQSAFRTAAMQALAREADLKACVASLTDAGLQPIALKGAWLARHAYPEPAQRPMLDIDLLLDPATVMAAWDLLRAQGYAEVMEAEMPLADILRLDKHLPPLVSPRGTLVELHQRLWELPGRLDHLSPAGQDNAIRARAVTVDGLRYPCGEDMLIHLIVHAAYSHRLDCGPRVLADIDFLLRQVAIDWTGFWTRAACEGWRDGARLVLELVAASRAGVTIDFTSDRGRPVPAEVRDGAIELLLIDQDRRASAGVAASALKGGMGALLGRMLRRRTVTGEPASDAVRAPGGGLRWASGRAAQVMRDLSTSDVRRQAGNLARLSRWFDA